MTTYAATVERLSVAVYAPDKPEETPESTARALWWAASGTPKSVARATEPLPALAATAIATLETLVTRRLAGEPLAYLTGRQEFMGRDFLASRGALIPRKETEILGNAAAALLREVAPGEAPVRILDLCTGSGNLAVTLALEAPGAEITATDLEAAALEVASANAELHGVASRLRFLTGDLFGALPLGGSGSPRFDLVTCNPPYIPSHKARNMPIEVGGHEPAAAFDGGDFGLSILFRLVTEAPGYLRAGGWLCFELGAGQGRVIEKRLASNLAYDQVVSFPDSAGGVRALAARCAHAH